MKKENEKRGALIIATLALIILLISIFSAEIGGLFGVTITGRADWRPQNISITVTGVQPAVIEYVYVPNTNALESSFRTITFNVHMSDADSVIDLNDTSVSANFSRPGETLRENASCVLENDIDGNTANYSCTIDMWYWDGSGSWNITIRGKDTGNNTWQYNTTEFFTYNQLKAMIISPLTLTWPALASEAINQTSDNDPTVINNTGNYNGPINITATNLLGETDDSEMIYAANFTIGDLTGASDPECVATQLANYSGSIVTTIIGSNSNPGNLSIGGGVGQEELYYCVPEVPPISSQTYSTLKGGSWTIAY